MQTKSNIQIIEEQIREKEKMYKLFENFINKYKFQDSIFSYSNGHIYEIVEGYFEVLKESNIENIKDIIKELDENKCIRINDQNIQLGLYHKNISEIKNIGKVYEIKTI